MFDGAPDAEEDLHQRAVRHQPVQHEQPAEGPACHAESHRQHHRPAECEAAHVGRLRIARRSLLPEEPPVELPGHERNVREILERRDHVQPAHVAQQEPPELLRSEWIARINGPVRVVRGMRVPVVLQMDERPLGQRDEHREGGDVPVEAVVDPGVGGQAFMDGLVSEDHQRVLPGSDDRDGENVAGYGDQRRPARGQTLHGVGNRPRAEPNGQSDDQPDFAQMVHAACGGHARQQFHGPMDVRRAGDRGLVRSHGGRRIANDVAAASRAGTWFAIPGRTG